MTKKQEKITFYQFMKTRFVNDNNIWQYIEELWKEYNNSILTLKIHRETKIDKLLAENNLEGYPEWNKEGTFLLKYKKWDIWTCYPKGTDGESWGLFAISLHPKQIIPLDTQKNEFAIDILKETLINNL